MDKRLKHPNAVQLCVDYKQRMTHNWSDDEGVKILKRCKLDGPRQGNGVKVIIFGIVMEYDKRDVKSA